MEQFKNNYPVLAIVFGIVGAEAKILANGNESFLQKLGDSAALSPQLLPLLGQATELKTELAKIKDGANAGDIVGGLELLVTDFGFSSEKAQQIQIDAFEFAEAVVTQIAPIETLINSAKKLIASIKA